MESESYDMRHKKVTGKGHQIVPAKEMLSDEYYEQDGDDHSDMPNHRRTMNQSSGFGLRMPPRPIALNSIIGKSKLLKANRYGHEDADFEDAGDDDDKDGDDPDDADFAPDFGDADEHWGTKDRDEDWDAEESDEEDNVMDDDLDISDEDDIYTKKSRARHSAKSGQTSKSTKERSLAPSARRKTGRTFIEEDEKESSAENSEYYSDDGFRNARRDPTARRKNGGQSESIKASARSNELRTSGRSVRKVSYVESDESEDVDEGKKMRPHKTLRNTRQHQHQHRFGRVKAEQSCTSTNVVRVA